MALYVAEQLTAVRFGTACNYVSNRTIGQTCCLRGATSSEQWQLLTMALTRPVLPGTAPTVSEAPLVSTRLDHIQFGCAASPRCGRTRDTGRSVRNSEGGCLSSIEQPNRRFGLRNHLCCVRAPVDQRGWSFTAMDQNSRGSGAKSVCYNSHSEPSLCLRLRPLAKPPWKSYLPAVPGSLFASRHRHFSSVARAKAQIASSFPAAASPGGVLRSP